MLADHSALQRINEEFIVWMTTVSPSGRPQSSPVWFLVEAGEFLVYSLDSARTRNIDTNPNVAINLNSDFHGSKVVSMEGTARIDPSAPPAADHERYLAKYRERMAGYGWTPEGFSEDYCVPIRVSITRIRSW